VTHESGPTPMRSRLRTFLPLTLPLLTAAGLHAAALKPEDVEFFETRIRPALVAECYECHDAKKQKGELRLDHREGLLKGGDEGPSIVPGDPARSLLIQSITHEHEDLKMPKKRPKLDARIIEDFKEWVRRGAPDPRDRAPTDSVTPTWKDLLSVRRNWWSFQPVRAVPPPEGEAASPIDRFIDARIAAAGITPSGRADKATLIRRASYAVTGLPPTPSEIAAFEADASPEAFTKVVDRLLASSRYGEHFARHWMDLVRYADTHGSEGDPAIPQSWRYRDYLIRAFNADVPYDRFVREHVAGDLLPAPRTNPEEGLNESAIGTAHFRMVEHGYQPVDTVDEQVRNVDNQIDVISKAFLGLTVSCSRCHDHKFDAISQADFYAFYGILASSRPGQVIIESAERLNAGRERLSTLKSAIREELAVRWRTQARNLPGALEQVQRTSAALQPLKAELAELESRISAASFRHRLRTKGDTGPTPDHWWTFEKDGRDLLGGLDAKPAGGAVFQDGRLVLKGDGAFAQTESVTAPFTTKTLEAWVSLGTLDQRGGGVVTIESVGGAVFDSIVYAEKQRRCWMAGSNNGVRSRDVGGPAETSSKESLIHVAAVYGVDGRITLYRNGAPYGESYAPQGADGTAQVFKEGRSRILFGRRHTGGGNAFLKGEIEEARAYHAPLTAQQVLRSFQAGPLRGDSPAAPGEDDDLAALRAQAEALRKRIAEKDAGHARLVAGLSNETDPDHPLHASTMLKVGLRPKPGKSPRPMPPDIDLSTDDADEWIRSGNAFSGGTAPGDFRIETAGDDVVTRILPSGVHSHTLSTRHAGVLMSPRFKVTTDFISVQAMGKGATLRLIPDNYPISPGGSRFPKAKVDAAGPTWITLDTAYRKGSYAYLELTLPADSTNPDGKDSELGWFGVRQVIFHRTRQDGPSGTATVAPTPALPTVNSLANALSEAAHAWSLNRADEAQAALLDAALRHGILDAGLNGSPRLAELVAQYRKAEREVTIPRRAPGLLEAAGFNQPLYARGDHNRPESAVPRRYLEAFDPAPFRTAGSGRLELAEKLASTDNPLTARVMVNRLWHHVFGRGLVGTVDNFGRLGELPTHPELLDHLALRFIEQRWSVKALVRELMLTEAFQRDSVPTESARTQDTANDLLSHMRVRRITGETLRDTLILLSGRLRQDMYGPGDNATAPPGEQVRRSIYLNVRRNTLNPLITTFDGPKPFTTVGRRDSTNVPAQSLTLLNDPFVLEAAKGWIATLPSDGAEPERLRTLFVQSLGRPPSAAESAAAARYLADLRAAGANETSAWLDLAQSMLNLKEFIYVR
jgi:hypothetical protein